MADRSLEPTEDQGGVVIALSPRTEGSTVWEPWLDERAIARHFACTTGTVRRWRVAGMPSRSIGGVRRYRLSACESWHEQREPA